MPARPPRPARWQRLSLAATLALHVALLASLAQVHGLGVRLPDPASIEVKLVRPLAADVRTPRPTALKPHLQPTLARSAEAIPSSPSPAPAALSADAAGVDASARYRLLAAQFNACPTLLVKDRVFRHGAADADCVDVHGHPSEAAKRHEPDPQKPRQYALDRSPSRIVFDSKDEAETPALKIDKQPLREVP